jgi:hypothetical protein
MAIHNAVIYVAVLMTLEITDYLIYLMCSASLARHRVHYVATCVRICINSNHIVIYKQRRVMK